MEATCLGNIAKSTVYIFTRKYASMYSRELPDPTAMGISRAVDPDSCMVVGSGYFGRIRIRVFWLDPDSSILIGSGV